MKRLMLAVTMGAATLALAQPPATKEVAGRWRSAAPEDMGNGSFCTREFALTDKTWALVFTIAADKEAKQPLVAMTFEGPWAATGDSASVPGAREATFEFKKKSVTLLAKDPAVAKGFGMDSCGLEVGKRKDVSKTGCSFVASVAQYGKEFDLLKRDGEQLFFGARPADGNMGAPDKRPAALGAPLVKAK